MILWQRDAEEFERGLDSRRDGARVFGGGDSTFKRPHGFILEGQAANGIRDVVRLLSAFEIPKDRLQLFLRQDRDAERGIA